MIDQMQRWGFGNTTFIPAAVRVGYNPATILTQLHSWISNSTMSNFHHGGGIEDLDVAPVTLCEMFNQSFQDTTRLFAVWPANTYAKFGDLMANGGFLISSDIETNGVQYVRIISNKGRNFTFCNPWPGQTVRVYRNGIDSGTVSGKAITIKTSVNEIIHLATDGTPLSWILARMAVPGGTVAGVANGPQSPQSNMSCSIAKKLFSRSQDRGVSFYGANAYKDMKKMTVDVYALDGTLVKEIVSNGAVVRWNMKSKGDTPVSTGAYVYKIKLERANRATEASGIFQIVQ
jgi:hypothetical protein